MFLFIRKQKNTDTHLIFNICSKYFVHSYVRVLNMNRVYLCVNVDT